MKWRCWSCGTDFVTSGSDRPFHCAGAAYTPFAEQREPSENIVPQANLHGDHEDVVMFMVTNYGGRFGVKRRQDLPNYPLAVVVWIPPERVEDEEAYPIEILHRLQALHALAAAYRRWMKKENAYGRSCGECLDCGEPDGPAWLTDCGHESCSYCGERYRAGRERNRDEAS